MDRAVALEKIRSARVARGISYEDLGKAIGTKDPTYIAAALHGQHRLNADEAKKLAAAVDVDAETAMVTTAMPLRTDFPLTTDPFKYRLMELVGVYGDALRERCNELFGDGARRPHHRREVPALQGVLRRTCPALGHTIACA